jgi:endonuclease/exonuclease/phosphatase family metal-dependent hydrolase
MRGLQAGLAALAVAACSASPHPRLAPDFTASCRSTPTVQGRSASVQWSEPDGDRHRARLESWCAGVGPILFRDEALNRVDRDVPDLEELTFVSWNVHVGGADLDGLVRDLQSGRLSGGRRRGHIILMLQEAVRSDGVPRALPSGASAAGWIGSEDSPHRGEIGTLARDLKMSVFYAPSMRNGAASTRHLPTDRGNAILSSQPLFRPTAIELPGERQRRVAVTAIVEVKAGDEPMALSIGSAHLDAVAGPRSLWLFGAIGTRRAQAKSLMAALPDGVLVLGADLNTWLGPHEPAARDLFQFLPSTPDSSREATFTAGLVLDYMFFRPPPRWRAHVQRAAQRYGSDHYPLIGWLDPE